LDGALPQEAILSDPFLGEIKMWAFAWAPQNWLLCNGSILPVTQNQALFALIGKQFGGDGKTTFALPDLRGRTPIGTGTSPDDGTVYTTGNQVGSETVTLSPANVPSHSHAVQANSTDAGTAVFPAGNYLAKVVPQSSTTLPFNVYLPFQQQETIPDPQVLGAAAVSTYGGGQGHPNMQPYTVVNFCICSAGIWPPRN
jgi:microcystin-dependent protein